MNVVEAIDEWIDEEIDDLTDEELEAILEVYDSVVESPFAHLETNQIFNEDIDDIVGLLERDDEALVATAHWMLRSSIYGESSSLGDDDTAVDSIDNHDTDQGGEGARAFAGADRNQADLEDREPEDRDLEDADLEDREPEDRDLEDADLEDREPEDRDLEDGEFESGDSEDREPNLADTDASTEQDPDRDEFERGADDTEPDEFEHETTDTEPDQHDDNDRNRDTEPAAHDDTDEPDEFEHETTDTEPDQHDDNDRNRDTEPAAHGNNDEPDEFEHETTDNTDGRGDDADVDRNDGDRAAVHDQSDPDAASDDPASDEPASNDPAHGDDDTELLGRLGGHAADDDNDNDDDEAGLLGAPAEKGELDNGWLKDSHDDADLLGTLARAEGRSDDADFYGELARLSTADATTASPAELQKRMADRFPGVTAPPLQKFDALGPSFLDPPAQTPETAGKPWRRWALTALMIGGLAAFIFGVVQLVSTLDEPDEVASVPDPAEEATAKPEQAAAPEPTAADAVPTPSPAPAAANGAVEATPEPEPERTPEPRIALRLTNGSVLLASFNDPTGPPNVATLYNSTDSDLTPATNVSWVGDSVAAIDTNGDIVLVNPNAAGAEPDRIYESGDGLDQAEEVALLLNQLAVRTSAGDIVLAPLEEPASVDNLTIVWDASEEGAAATDLEAIEDLLPFTLDNGDVQMFVASGDQGVTQIWSAEDQPPAFNLAASPRGILIGVGQGAVAEFALDDVEGPPLRSAWDPFSTDETPAIGYSPAGNRTAVVLADGAIVMADDTGTGERIWDPADTELRALSVAGDPIELIVLLETGSVVRLPLTAEGVIESVWDVTDETLTPAAQVALEPLIE